MGNYQFTVPNPPKAGQIMSVIGSPFTIKEQFPPEAIHQGTKVKVLGTKNLLCSRPNAPQITASLVMLSTGQHDVILSNNLR